MEQPSTRFANGIGFKVPLNKFHFVHSINVRLIKNSTVAKFGPKRRLHGAGLVASTGAAVPLKLARIRAGIWQVLHV